MVGFRRGEGRDGQYNSEEITARSTAAPAGSARESRVRVRFRARFTDVSLSDTCSHVFPSCRHLQRQRFCYRRLRRLPETQVFLHGHVFSWGGAARLQAAACTPRAPPGAALGRWPRCHPRRRHTPPHTDTRHEHTDTRARPRSGARRRDAAPLGRDRGAGGRGVCARDSAGTRLSVGSRTRSLTFRVNA